MNREKSRIMQRRIQRKSSIYLLETEKDLRVMDVCLQELRTAKEVILNESNGKDKRDSE